MDCTSRGTMRTLSAFVPQASGMDLDLFHILSFIVLFPLCVMALFLFTHTGGRRLSNVLLGSFFLAWALGVFDGVAYGTGLYARYPQWALVANLFSLLLGPLLYLYTRSLLYNDFRLRWLDSLHALPFFAVLLWLQWGYQQLPPAEQQTIVDSALTYGGTPLIIGTLLAYAQVFTYLALAYRTLYAYRRRLRDQFSDLEHRNVSWLSFTLGGFGLLLVVSILQNTARFALSTHMYNGSLILTALMLLGFMTLVLFKSLKQPELFAGIAEDAPDARLTSAVPTTLQDEADRLQQFMEAQQPYLTPSLTLQDLSDALNRPPRLISQTINTVFEQNFFDYVNSYRIDDAKRLLAHPDETKTTILEVMYRVGFNSKSSFNTAFKKFTDMTPTQYKQRSSRSV